MNKHSRAFDWLIAGALGLAAAALYFFSLADYVFPGVSASLVASWRGLDATGDVVYPLMAVFAKALGCGNVIAPVCGILATAAIYLLVTAFVRERITTELPHGENYTLSRVCGLATAIIFMLTPAVREAATHLEPRLFDATWALLSFLLFAGYLRAPRMVNLIFPVLIGAMAGLGYLDSALFLALLPFYIAALIIVPTKRGAKPYLPMTLFTAAFLIAFFVGASRFEVDLTNFLRTSSSEFKSFYSRRGWILLAAFSTLPFIAVLFSSFKAYNEKPGLVQWIYHGAVTIAAILAVATPLAPSELLRPSGILPIVTSVFAAFVAGHVLSYWWLHRKTVLAKIAGGILAVVLLVTLIWNLFVFDGDRGAFADGMAKRILAALGERTWFVSDGTLDNHLRIAAADAGKDLTIISMNRDLDEKYLQNLSDIVRAKNVGGSKNADLALSLSLGVLPFLQDWFASDPTIGKQVAIYGAPDLWYSVGIRPVPELYFFGSDPSVTPDWKVWPELDKLLKVPKGWGSYRGRRTDDPVAAMRQSIRRHMGLVATDRGVWLQDEKLDDEAFALYELVLNEIDPDNLSALFNEVEMAGAKYQKAVAKRRDFERQIKSVVDDKARRYHIWRLGAYYGYVRNPDMFVRLGYAWARSGRPGDALSQIRRAIDFVPSERRAVLLNMMAALYANESDRRKSRALYESVLAKNDKDHDALIGMMRLELQEGNSAKAISYLERAIASNPEGHRILTEKALYFMLKGDLLAATDLLRKATDAEPGNLQAWALLAATTMQRVDAENDPKAKEKIQKEIENTLLPSMEKHAQGQFDYFLQTTRAFLLLRQGSEKRREARDAFIVAAKSRPDIAAASDIVLNLDIALDEKKDAETHARAVLRRNRNAPLANYVMGSLALGKGDIVRAEQFLRKAVVVAKPVPLALNDLAEVLRRKHAYAEAEQVARRAVDVAPGLYVAWETLGSILLDAKRNLDEAESCVNKACELSRMKNGREADVRMLVTLARVQLRKGDFARAKTTLRKVENRASELGEFEKTEYEALKKSAR